MLAGLDPSEYVPEGCDECGDAAVAFCQGGDDTSSFGAADLIDALDASSLEEHSCIGQCYEQHSSGQCWCDAGCMDHGDCCADSQDVCIANEEIMGAIAAPEEHSCADHCSDQHSSGQCWCDSECHHFGDCCADITDQCGFESGLLMKQAVGQASSARAFGQASSARAGDGDGAFGHSASVMTKKGGTSMVAAGFAAVAVVLAAAFVVTKRASEAAVVTEVEVKTPSADWPSAV
jgi:hypothetical protein